MFSDRDEAREVLEFFTNAFELHKNRPIVLYGIGVNTKILIHNLKNYHIAGVMDAKHEGEMFEGLPVFSEEEVKQVTDTIVIVARAAVVPLIYNRIKYLEEFGIAIFDVRGVNLAKTKNKFSLSTKYLHRATLEKLILGHEVICFDIFDTLISRKVVQPEDIFEIVERRLIKKGLNINFRILRETASGNAYEKKISPTLTDIYTEMACIGNVDSITLANIKEEEFQTELDFTAPRESVISLLKFAQKAGKKVYLVSDMYLEASYIERLLKKYGIKEYDRLIISCEYSKCKWPSGELFEVVKKDFPLNTSILHIGDNEGADITCAIKRGLDAVKVPNNYEIMIHSPFQILLSFNRSLGDSIAIGIFSCQYLSDPFKDYNSLCFEKENDLGFICYGPLIVGYLSWCLRQCKNHNEDFLAFVARDGWILNKVWKVMSEFFPYEKIPPGNYVLGSRRTLAISAIRNKKDIESALQKVPDSMEYSKMLSSRFGIENVTLSKDEGKTDCVFNRIEEILKNAEQERNLYMRYVDKKLDGCKRVAVIDAVSSGTIGKYFFKTTKKQGIFLCIVLSKVPNYSVYDEIEAYAYMGEDSKYAPKRSVHKFIGELEGVLTSYEPMFVCFNKFGKEQYASAELDNDALEVLKKIHAGILKYAQEIYCLTPNIDTLEFTPELSDAFFSLYYEKNLCLLPNIKKTLKGIDNF